MLPTSGDGSYRLVYGSVDEEGNVVERASYQAGDWLARCELQIKHTPGLLERYGLEAYQPHVHAFVEENYAALDAFGPLLLHYGQDAVSIGDIPTKLPRHESAIISITIIDENSVSMFGVHSDTPQLLPCVVTADSVYPLGVNDYQGGEFLYANGVHLEQTTRSSAHVLCGHRAVHTVMPLAPKQVPTISIRLITYDPV